jgi:hypothetical protein
MFRELPIDIHNKDTNKEGISVPYNILSNIYVDAVSDTLNNKTAGSFLIQSSASSFEYHPRPSYGFDWGFIASLTFLLLLAFIKVIFLRTSKMSSYRMLMRKTYNKTNYTQEAVHPYFSAFPFMICSWIVFSLILYTFTHQLFEHNRTIILFLVFGSILTLFVIRFFLFKFVELLFGIKTMIAEFRYLTKKINFFIAFFTFPFVFVNYYYPHLFLITPIILIFAALSLYRIFLGWSSLKQNFQVYEYFLYLCTIEILPLLILLKFISNELLVF